MNKRTEQTRWTPKRLLSLLMALIMTLSLLPTAALAADGDAPTLGTSAANPVVITFSSNQFATADTSPITTQISEEGSTPYTVTFKPQIQFVDSNGKGTASTFIYQSDIPFKPGVSISTNANEAKTIGQYTYTVQQVNADGTAVTNTTTVANNIGGTSKIPAARSLSCGGSDFTAKALENNMIRLKYTVYEGDSVDENKLVGKVYVGITGITVTDIKYTITYRPGAGADWATTPTGLSETSESGVYATTVTPGEDGKASYTIDSAASVKKDGHTFVGWRVGANGSTGSVMKAGDTIGGITGDVNLYAELEKNHTITFQSEYSGASGLMTSAPSNGTKYTVPVEPTMYGFTFAGWKVTSGSADVTGNEITNITGDITLTAQWTADGSTPVGSHSVKFVRNNATDGSALNWPDDLTGAKDSTVTIPWLIPQAEGYTFLGWSTTENATTANYQPNDTVTITDTDINLYAVWQPKNYTITYPDTASLTGVTFTSTGHSVTPGSPASFNVTVTAEYDVSSMIVAANGVPLGYSRKTENNDGSTTYTYSFMPTGDTTVTVSQPEQKSYVVTLPVGDHFKAKFDDTDTKSDKTVTYNGSVSFTVTADSGWTIEDVSYTGDATLTHDATKYTLTDIKSNVAISVKMKQIPVYTISYSIDEAYFTSQKVTGESTDVTLITPAERTGYTFDGWYKNLDYTDKAKATLDVNGDVNLYGRYMPKTYSINYDLNAPTGATVTPNTIDATTKTYGQAVTLSAVTPTCDGYDFLGWAKEENKGLVVYAAGATVSEELTADMTLYAVWAKKTYTITLQGGSGYTVSSSQALVVEHGSTFTFTVTVDGAYAATMPTVSISSTANGTLTKTDGNPNFEHKAATYTYTISNVTADQVVTVEVTENARATVTFQYRVVDANGQELTNDVWNAKPFMTQAVQLGDPAAQPQQPNIEGYKFVRWCGADHPTATTHTDYDFTKPVADELTIYAEITPILPVITITELNGTGWKTENWKHGAEGTETTAAITTNAFTIAYGDNVTFDLVIAKGYDYSKLSVTANGLALGYQSATTDEKTGSTTLHYYLGSVMADTRIAITGIERKTITITYNANARDDVSGLPTAEKVKYYLEGVQNDTITTQVPSRTGYEFVGWCTDSEATVTVNGNTKTINTETGVVVYPSSTAKFTTDTTLYAIWLAQDTELTLKITDVAYDTQQNNRVIQYEGESITLQATLNVNAKGTVVFYKGDKEGTNGTRIGSAAINGKTAELSVKVGDYKAGGVTEHYWAVFVSETDEGYANSEKSNIMNVGVFSKAITWPLDTKNADTLTITEATGSMTAGKTYKLTVNITKILGLETVTPDNAPKLGEDYAIVWQYKNTVTGDWADMSAEITDTNEYQVTPEYAGHEYRAKIVPIGDLYTKAAKFDENGIVNNGYDKFLYTNTVGSVLQSTATALTIDAPEESKDIKINGDTPFTAIGEHKAQFEGQAVTLTAKVTKDGGTGVETGKVSFYRLASTDATGTQTWELISTVDVQTAGDNTGVASTTYTMGTYDSTSAGASATTNKETFKAVYVANETYEKSETDGNADVYIKSAKLMTPVIESELEGTNGAKATTYSKDLTGLLAGVQHEFKLRQTGAEATTGDWSVVALDGRTVDATNYDIKWLKTTGSNEQEVDATGTNQIKVDENKVDDRYRVKLTGKGVFAGSEATSKDAVIGTKQDVTVTVKAIDAITKTPETDVYQLNEITLTATVAAAKGADATMKPTGTVTFYYLEEGATNKWIELGTSTLTKDAQSTQGEMIATIQTTKLPVAKTTYTSLTSKITAVYSGDDTFQQNQTFTKDTASTKDLVFGTIANVNGNTTNNVEVTVRSSVVKGCADANKAVTTLSDTGIHISADGLAAHEGLVTLKLDEVYTLDAKEAYSKLLAGTDYTVQWQILSGASAHNNGGDYSSADAWVNIDGATGTTYTLTTVEQDAAYRAVITVANEPITKGSFTEIEQDANALLNGHKQYYSNVLCAADGQTTIDVLIDTNGRGTNKEGITEGETVNVNVFLSGATQATPIADVTVKIENDTAKGNNETYSTTLTGSTVNGWNVFPWNTVGVAPGFYKVTVSSKSNTGYADETVTRSLIVRESSYDFEVGNTNPTYNGRTQGLTVALNGFGFNGTGINEAANKSWTVKYYDKDNNLVEPTQAGKYTATITLPASAYWTEQTKTVDFTIEKRSVSIADAIAQAKGYDGTTDVNIVEVMLNDAETEQGTTGWLKSGENTGIINGDSIYAVATAASLNSANAGNNSFKISTIELRGDDANNYVWNEAPYTEDIYVSRSQVYGVSSTDVTLKAGEKLPADAVYMIDQAGNKITTYDVLYYLHTDTEIKKVDNTNEKGLYTVIVRPKQDNYKSGVTLKVTVGDTTSYTPAVAPKPSTLLYLSDTATKYNPAGNAPVTAKNAQGNAVKVEYQTGTTWSETVPSNAGRYLVKATDTNTGDVAYGIYTITKAHPSIDVTPATGLTYNSMPQNGYTGTPNVGTESAESYFTYAGDVAIGYNTPADGNVDEQAPVDAGTYTVTLHVNETANYTAHEISKSFTIAKKALTIKAKHVGAWQYGSMPGFYASYEGLAGDVNDSTPDTSLRDVQIAPELLFNPTSNNQSNYSNDALDQVGKIIIRPVDALSKNYELTPVDGEFTKNEEDPKPTLTILGLPQNGKSADVTVYYGDEIQLSAYGNYLARRNTSSFLKWEITNSTLTNGSVSIDENNILHVNGVGTFTVKLTRGTARQAITTEINVTAIQKEAKIALKNVDKVYNGASQTYDYTDNVTVHDELYQPIGNFVDSKLTRTNTARINVGTQITTAKVTGAWAYQSETYGGKFTINDKDATVAPVAQSTVYGTLETFDTTPTYKVDGNAGSVDPVTGVNVASQTDAYNRLDVHDGYEILVAGTENMNYNVKYTTDETAEDSAVTTYQDVVFTSKTDKYLNDATIYGETPNVLDWTLVNVIGATRDSVDYADNLADFDLPDTFVWQDKDDCTGNKVTYKAANRTTDATDSSNIRYNQDKLEGPRTSTDTATDENYTLKFNTVENSGKALLANNYKLTNVKTGNSEATTNALTANSKGFIIPATGESNDVSGENFVEGSANIAQRPIKLEKAVDDVQLYWKLSQKQLYTALVNVLKAEENSVGRGLAKGHTIEDLDLSFTIKVGSTAYNVAKDGTDAINFAATGNATVTATVGDTNYKLEGGQYQFDIVLKNIQIEATYTTKTFTGFTVLIKVHNEGGAITPLNDAKGLSYKIFKKTGDTIDKTTAYASGTLTYQNRTAYDDKGVLCGVFTATYPQLPLLNSGETYFIQMYEYGVELKTNS